MGPTGPEGDVPRVTQLDRQREALCRTSNEVLVNEMMNELKLIFPLMILLDLSDSLFSGFCASSALISGTAQLSSTLCCDPLLEL